MTAQTRSATIPVKSPLAPDGGKVSIDVGARLRMLRAGAGLSIRALAERSGLNVNTLPDREREDFAQCQHFTAVGGRAGCASN